MTVTTLECTDYAIQSGCQHILFFLFFLRKLHERNTCPGDIIHDSCKCMNIKWNLHCTIFISLSLCTASFLCNYELVYVHY